MYNSNYINSGVKSCVRLMLRSGRFIDCTPDHKIMTSEGWVQASKITEETAVATIRKIPEPESARYISESRFLGWMLGDGCTRGDTPTFTSNDHELSERFISESYRLYGLTAKRRKLKDGMTHDEIAVSIGKGHTGKAHNPCTENMKRWEMWGVKAECKKIPVEFMATADSQSVAELLSGLIDTDGCIANSNGRVNVRFDSCSEDLAQGVMWCLLRLGVHGRISSSSDKRMVFGKYYRLKMWRVIIDSGVEVSRLRNVLTLCKRKMDKLNSANLSTRPSNLVDTLPFWVWREISKEANRHGVKARCFIMSKYQNRRITANRLREISKLFELPERLKQLSNPEIFWDRKKSISNIGNVPTFDMSVNPQHPNFVANGIVVHNSVENSAQLVMGAWRPQMDRMNIKLLKQTKRAGNPIIECMFDGDRQKITEINNTEERII